MKRIAEEVTNSSDAGSLRILQNVSGEWKKAKTEKESEVEGRKKPPFICAIYRRDIASFLSREQVQHWRLTSSHSNAPLSRCPSLLTRFKYYSLTVIFVRADRYRVKKDGFLHFLDRQSDIYSMDKKFNSIDDFRLCCRDVEDRATKLVGQRLYFNKPDDEGVAFRFDVDERTWLKKAKVVCRVPNLLTEKTAPAMLHFLHHLSQICFQNIEIEPAEPAGAAEWAFNPLVVRVLPKFQLRGVRFRLAGSSGPLREEPQMVVKTASEMRIRFNCLYSWVPRDDKLSRMLDFIATGRHLKKRLELEGVLRNHEIERIVEHFKKDVHTLQGTIRDVRLENTNHGGENGWSTNWPIRFPPRKTATQVTKRGDGTVDYLFNYANAHTGEPFSLLLGISHYDDRMMLTCRCKFTFG